MEIQREFDYRPPSGPLKLLGILCVILGPITVVMAMQGDVDRVQFRNGIWLTFTGAAAPWALGAAGVVMVLAGVAMVKGAIRQQREGGRVAFLPHSVLFDATKSGSVSDAFKYKDISGIEIAERKGRRLLSFTHPKGKIEAYSSYFTSPEEFEEMCAELRQRVITSPRS